MAYATADAFESRQNNNLMVTALTMFVAIVAAVTVSAVIVSSMVKGQIANALEVAPVTAPQTTSYNPGVSVGVCGTPVDTSTTSVAVVSAPVAGGNAGLVPLFARGGGSISGSFNNTSYITTTNTETNTTTTTTTDDHSDNRVDSHNSHKTIIRDNGNTEIDSRYSGNTLTFAPQNNDTTNTTTTTNTAITTVNDSSNQNNGNINAPTGNTFAPVVALNNGNSSTTTTTTVNDSSNQNNGNINAPTGNQDNDGIDIF